MVKTSDEDLIVGKAACDVNPDRATFRLLSRKYTIVTDENRCYFEATYWCSIQV